MKNFDIAIIGGGLAGLTMASLLGRHNLKLACIDQTDPAHKPRDLRTTAISFGSRKVLERAGVWAHITQACPIKDIEILDGDSPVLLEFLGAEVDDKAFGWIVDNHHLKTALMQCLKGLNTVTHITGANVTGFNHTQPNQNNDAENILHYVKYIHNSTPKSLSARLIIGADGRASKTRDHMDVNTRQWSYNQRAIICTVIHEHPHNNIAVEHFWPQGPFAILPFCDDDAGTHRSAVVFTEHGPERNSLMRLSDEAFTTALAARFPDRYGTVKMNGRRVAYPLNLVHAQDYIKPGFVLIADAAHGIHPIAGQGLNLGFRDIDELDHLIDEALATGEDFASWELLQTYQRRRRPDNMAMVAMTDGLNRLFSNNKTPIRALRKAGLKMISHLKPARRFLMRQAMGDR